MTIQEAYRMTFNDMLNKNSGMLFGNYDANDVSDDFMNGVGAVMAYIAYHVSDEDGDNFINLFTKNLIASEQKAKNIKCYKCAELEGCWKGQHGGKEKCRCFSPKG